MDINQITLEAADFDASLAFYQRLGLTLIVLSEGRYARFELPSGSTTLSIHRADTPVISHAVLYFEVEDVDRHCEALKARGILFDTEPRDESWLWREARFSDPSGNRLCLYHAGSNRRFPPWRLPQAKE
ncbi:VOC family protein [Allorhizobium sp. BGMRC 0089]|uniref:VOC family protein n=1 Tax=Allorhizobium sonneratiae TaxID=2934936 RepID=UPI00203467EF|nr:VOC family protein [Allorhizobium sonneratiae]MCM2294248.1 VOC family protein [Allorhizobium sonneratiae]